MKLGLTASLAPEDAGDVLAPLPGSQQAELRWRAAGSRRASCHNLDADFLKLRNWEVPERVSRDQPWKGQAISARVPTVEKRQQHLIGTGRRKIARTVGRDFMPG